MKKPIKIKSNFINKISDKFKKFYKHNALTDSYKIYKVNRYDIKRKQHLKKFKKYYVCELGIRNIYMEIKK